MSDTQIIGLSGYARSGKDTTAQFLIEELGFERVAFADALREALYTLNPLVDTITSAVSGNEDRVQNLVDQFGWDYVKTTFPEVRALLQRMGTEVGRNLLGDNVWVDIAMRNVKPGGKYVFTDMRFPNEFAAITEAGGRVWRIERDGTKPVNAHPSETALDNFAFDAHIVNCGTVEELRSAVLELVKS